MERVIILRPLDQAGGNSASVCSESLCSSVPDISALFEGVEEGLHQWYLEQLLPPAPQPKALCQTQGIALILDTLSQAGGSSLFTQRLFSYTPMTFEEGYHKNFE